MILWLNTHYVIVFVISFVCIFVMMGGWMVPFIWRDLFDKRRNARKGIGRMVVAQLIIALVGALLLNFFCCFSYTEDQLYRVRYENR